jgi:hypothetical protein
MGGHWLTAIGSDAVTVPAASLSGSSPVTQMRFSFLRLT